MEKEYILQEIKRTAQENGGAPLGISRFEKETGIHAEDCIGRYWARWSDALREAGYSPNEMTAAYPDALLFERYIELAREIGRLPVKAEIQIRARNTSDFPSTTAFNRLGAKAQFVKRLKAHCEKRLGYEDIIRMCDSFVPRSHAASGHNDTSCEIGFVYLAKSGNFYKIGRTNSAGRRGYELAIQLPERVRPVHTIRTDDPPGIESYWHGRFAGKRKNGEWFELDTKDVAAFKRRKFM